MGRHLRLWPVPDRPGQRRQARFTERDGLANNVIYQILPDASGRLWLSTNNGLSVFDPDTGLFQNLGQRDGLLSQEFNSSAGWRTPDGRRLWFGGTRGVDVIDPCACPGTARRPARC
jgi:ligand-binding sensor domain-containing protein